MVKFDACLDEITPDGRVIGWACLKDHVERLHVGIFWDGVLVAETVAQDYRPGLLTAGYGLGHCEFNARLIRAPDPGEHEMEMKLMPPEHAALRFKVTVPQIAQTVVPSVLAKPGWRVSEVLDNVRWLQLDEQLAVLGPRRFVDGIVRFLHGEWADDAMIDEVRHACSKGLFDANSMFEKIASLMSNPARRECVLPSVFDHRFPFRYPVRSR